MERFGLGVFRRVTESIKGRASTTSMDLTLTPTDDDKVSVVGISTPFPDQLPLEAEAEVDQDNPEVPAVHVPNPSHAAIPSSESAFLPIAPQATIIPPQGPAVSELPPPPAALLVPAQPEAATGTDSARKPFGYWPDPSAPAAPGAEYVGKPVGYWPDPSAPAATGADSAGKPMGYWPDPSVPDAPGVAYARQPFGYWPNGPGSWVAPGRAQFPNVPHPWMYTPPVGPQPSYAPPQLQPLSREPEVRPQHSTARPLTGRHRTHGPASSDSESDWDDPAVVQRRQKRSRPKIQERAIEVSTPKYNGKYDFTDFKSQFECVAEDYGWDDGEMGRRLSRCLTDEARAVLSTLDNRQRRDYKTLCEALASLHSTPGGEGLRRKELQQARRAEGQDPNKFGRELRRLAKRAYPRGDINELILVQIFSQGLNDPQLERHVLLQGPETLSEAIRHACNYEAYSGADAVPKKPKVLQVAQAVAQPPASRPTEHSQTSHLESLITTLCGRLEALAPKEQPRQAPANKPVVCYACKGPGHFARNCPHRLNLQMPPAVMAIHPPQPYNSLPPNPHMIPTQSYPIPPLFPPQAYGGPPPTQQFIPDSTNGENKTYPEDRNSLNC
jgi:hypothetical protein